jgi:hypothetical protein
MGLEMKDQPFFQPGNADWDPPEAQLVHKFRNELMEPAAPVGAIVHLKQLIQIVSGNAPAMIVISALSPLMSLSKAA